MTDPLAYLAKMDEDTVYFHQDIRQPEKEEFVRSIVIEVNVNRNKKHWELIPNEYTPEGETILESVWTTKQKR